jgi:hypothetical protein
MTRESGATTRRVFYGVVSAQTEKVVEFFLEDEQALAKDLRVEAIELG